GGAGPDVVRQSRYTLANLGKSFASVGGKAENVAKAQVYLTDGTTWAPFMHDWRGAFATPPALTVAEEGLFVPEGLLEIDVTGYIPRTGLATGPVGEPSGPAGAPPAFRVGDLLFASGRIAVDASGMVPLEATVHPTWPNYGSAIKLQTRWVLDRLAETFAAAGSDLSRACRANVFLTDLNHFEAMETVWREYFPEPPARTLVGSPGLGHPDALIAVDLIGLCG
ncbi:MAG: RidA family protein, partial [Acetobacterales bacterium]